MSPRAPRPSALRRVRQGGVRIAGRVNQGEALAAADARITPAAMASAAFSFFHPFVTLRGTQDSANVDFIAPFLIQRDATRRPFCAVFWRNALLDWVDASPAGLRFPPRAGEFTCWRETQPDGTVVEHVTLGEAPHATDALFLLYAIAQFES